MSARTDPSGDRAAVDNAPRTPYFDPNCAECKRDWLGLQKEHRHA